MTQGVIAALSPSDAFTLDSLYEIQDLGLESLDKLSTEDDISVTWIHFWGKLQMTKSMALPLRDLLIELFSKLAEMQRQAAL